MDDQPTLATLVRGEEDECTPSRGMAAPPLPPAARRPPQQMAGRAGRRGLDAVGRIVFLTAAEGAWGGFAADRLRQLCGAPPRPGWGRCGGSLPGFSLLLGLGQPTLLKA